jgi:hypothetical protein
MKKKNYACKNCGKKYSNINRDSFNRKCLTCKKNNKTNKALKCYCFWYGKYGYINGHKGRIVSQATSYAENSMNYVIACRHEEKEIDLFWQEAWENYYLL